MKLIRWFVTLVILAIALITALYASRVDVADWWRSVNAPALPEAVTYDEAVIESPPPSQGALPAGRQGVGGGQVEEQPQTPLNPPPSTSLGPGLVRGEIEEMNLAVPFTPQAPHANWDLPYKEACEEASLYMVVEYFKGTPEGLVDAAVADEALLSIIDLEASMDLSVDVTVEELGRVALAGWNYQSRLIENPTVEDIKTELIAGHPVIVPLAGRQIGNPYFTPPGPIYHMLVIRGFTADGQFITNDPGTYRGESYLYDFDILMEAMHDWNGGADIDGGKKVVLVVYP